MRVAARPENRFKPRRLILTFSYRFAKFPNSFSLSIAPARASQPPGSQKLSLPMGNGNTVPKFPYLPYFARPANPALCKLRFIPQTVNVFLPPLILPPCAIDTSRKFCNQEIDRRYTRVTPTSNKRHRDSHDISRSYVINHFAHTTV